MIMAQGCSVLVVKIERKEYQTILVDMMTFHDTTSIAKSTLDRSRFNIAFQTVQE